MSVSKIKKNKPFSLNRMSSILSLARVRKLQIVSGPLKGRGCSVILKRSEEYVQYFSWTCCSGKATSMDQAAFSAKIK
jgi:hypothetical protein